jgi:Tetracyclin repressor-like, C-terminal domain
LPAVSTVPAKSAPMRWDFGARSPSWSRAIQGRPVVTYQSRRFTELACTWTTEGEPPAPSDDREAAIRESALSVHAALRRHPWAPALLMAPGRIRPARLRYMDSLLGRLREGGFSADMTYHAYHVLDGHIFGFSLWEAAHTFSDEDASRMAASFDRLIPADEYPTSASTASSTSRRARTTT